MRDCHLGQKYAEGFDYMKVKEEDFERIRLAVRRLMRIGGSCSPNEIYETINESTEIEGLVLGIQYGHIIRNEDRIFIEPGLFFSLCAREEGVN